MKRVNGSFWFVPVIRTINQLKGVEKTERKTTIYLNNKDQQTNKKLCTTCLIANTSHNSQVQQQQKKTLLRKNQDNWTHLEEKMEETLWNKPTTIPIFTWPLFGIIRRLEILLLLVKLLLYIKSLLVITTKPILPFIDQIWMTTTTR